MASEPSLLNLSDSEDFQSALKKRLAVTFASTVRHHLSDKRGIDIAQAPGDRVADRFPSLSGLPANSDFVALSAVVPLDYAVLATTTARRSILRRRALSGIHLLLCPAAS